MEKNKIEVLNELIEHIEVLKKMNGLDTKIVINAMYCKGREYIITMQSTHDIDDKQTNALMLALKILCMVKL